MSHQCPGSRPLEAHCPILGQAEMSTRGCRVRSEGRVLRMEKLSGVEQRDPRDGSAAPPAPRHLAGD